MRVSSDLLFRLATALEPGRSPATLDGTEAEVQIPSVFSPIILVPGPMYRLGGFDPLAPQLESFTRDIAIAKANAVAGTSDVVTFSAGLWLVTAEVASLSNWTQPMDASLAGGLVLTDLGAVAEGLLSIFLVTNVIHTTRGGWLWSFVEDGWRIRMVVPGNGVGQTHEMRTCVSGVRLI